MSSQKDSLPHAPLEHDVEPIYEQIRRYWRDELDATLAARAGSDLNPPTTDGAGAGAGAGAARLGPAVAFWRGGAGLGGGSCKTGGILSNVSSPTVLHTFQKRNSSNNEICN